MNTVNKPKLMTAEEAAEYLGIKVSRIRTAVRRNELPFMRIGRLIRFEKAHLDKWIESSHETSEITTNSTRKD